MFISRSDGKITTTIRVNTGNDMLLALTMCVTGVGLMLASVEHPLTHYIRLLTGALLTFLGVVLARRTSRLIRRGERVYRGATKP